MHECMKVKERKRKREKEREGGKRPCTYKKECELNAFFWFCVRERFVFLNLCVRERARAS